MNIPILKSRLTRYLGDNQLRYDTILCHILHTNDYTVQKIALITGQTLTGIRQSLREGLSERDYAAWAYAICPDRADEWNDLGEAFMRSLPQITDEQVKEYTPFIVECMKWGMNV